jgi:hypothetical protein
MSFFKKFFKFIVNPAGPYGVAREATKVIAKKYPKVALAAAPIVSVVPVLGTSLAEVGTRKAYEELQRRQLAEITATNQAVSDMPAIADRNTSLAGSYEAGTPIQARTISDLTGVRSSSTRGSRVRTNQVKRKSKRKGKGKLKFGSPAWRKKYLGKGKRKGKRKGKLKFGSPAWRKKYQKVILCV